MTKYREILRLTALGLKQRDIMKSLGIAQKIPILTLCCTEKRPHPPWLSFRLAFIYLSTKSLC